MLVKEKEKRDTHWREYPPEAKYERDMQFRHLVDVLMGQLEQCYFSPSELREAAMLASIRWEQQNISQMVLVPEMPESVTKAIETLHDWHRQLFKRQS